MECVCLECAAKKVVKENSCHPLIFEVPPEAGRKRLEDAQSSHICVYPADTLSYWVTTEHWGTITVYCVIPKHLTSCPSVIYYLHGGGWVFGSLHTHRKLVHELACRTNSILIFPEYTRSPEAKFPTAIEQCYCVLCCLPELFKVAHINADLEALTVAGDSVGGNMATVMTLLSKYRNGPCIQKQLLYYPVTNAGFDTCSYKQFACNYYLYRKGMMWFWNQYAPCKKDRRKLSASPLLATLAQLQGLPDAMIINGEADVLHDEGQAYACKLRCAGVDVTTMSIKGIIHDFVMLNALDKTNGCRLAMDASVEWMNRNK